MSGELLTAGLKVMGLGLGGVFTVLILFFVAVKVMLAVFKPRKNA